MRDLFRIDAVGNAQIRAAVSPAKTLGVLQGIDFHILPLAQTG